MKVTLCWLMSVSVLLAASDVQMIAQKIDALATQNRLDEHVPYRVYDPFNRAKPLLAKVNEKPQIKRLEPIRVETILNGRALVDGKWVSKGDTVHEAKVLAIRENAMIIRYENREVMIPLHRGYDKLKTREVQE